jgi:hypothetical protein
MVKDNIENRIEEVEAPKDLKERREDYFRELGFSGEKEFNSFNSKARTIWKGKQKKIIYEDELSKEELEYIKKDITLSKLAKQRAETEKAIIFRLNELLKKYRNIEE